MKSNNEISALDSLLSRGVAAVKSAHRCYLNSVTARTAEDDSGVDFWKTAEQAWLDTERGIQHEIAALLGE